MHVRMHALIGASLGHGNTRSRRTCVESAYCACRQAWDIDVAPEIPLSTHLYSNYSRPRPSEMRAMGMSAPD